MSFLREYLHLRKQANRKSISGATGMASPHLHSPEKNIAIF